MAANVVDLWSSTPDLPVPDDRPLAPVVTLFGTAG